ncbi:tetrahydrofolate synthase KNAG_0A02940 [Huiozyma naganishii CBS 8797]|uniref:Folylpolyglutamate synthase n=1 Tax=Huiozyma naganishii (strain ATCC MYA-139 / BCRC 22969 / CBS 8797 / KCTC 17520 / NBRC 10181 / NCYC 3082 / Yp74L-3) TaxID=1071383 RepID=J7REM0_HUIN7|nr:hypothetical protein KNAG_0A02940 [Kazachstania naganishii CBS 8797]CCK67983.1 hypothetical protein KNAG_0A02940 [Kazachstania naganishii CBS 8797]
MRASLALRMASRTYNDAVAALNLLQSNYANIMAVRESGIRKNEMSMLEMKEWTRRVGYSVSDFNKLNVVHITGTKGKGSTAAFTASIFNEYKKQLPRVGLFTSPHLRSVRERIRINGEPISQEKFTKYFFELWERLENTSSSLQDFPHMTPGSKPGYFKYLTLLSFHTFMQEGCNTCVYEVGIGGEYDSTNLIEKPIACGVSLLGIDHTYMLGDTIEEIAWNKGGIFKNHTPAFTVAGQPKEGLRVLKERALERDTELAEVAEFDVLKDIELGIAGDFQRSNASLAIALASESLNALGITNDTVELKKGAKIPEKILNGVKNTKWEGRCQTLIRGDITWFVDGAHTFDSIQAASGWYKSVAQKSNRKKILLFNQQSRDANELLRCLDNTLGNLVHFDDAIFTTNVTWQSGTYSADLVSMNTNKEEVDKLSVQKELSKQWNVLQDGSNAHVATSIEWAVNLIEKLRDGKPVDVFVTGSLHLVGGLLVVLDRK